MHTLTSPHQPAGRRLAWTLICALLTALLSIGLAACGGGGGDAATAPAITTQPASVALAEGQSATFTVSAGGTAPLTYQWRKNGADIAGATASTYTSPAAALADNGALYTVLVGNSAGSKTSDAATLTVGTAVAPSVATQPVAASVVAGQTATFSVVAGGTTPISYQWTRDGTPISGASAASYTTPATAAADDGAAIAVIVTNIAGSATSDNASLTVTAAPVAPAITTPPAATSVNAGQTASFNVAAAGTNPLSYQWSRNGVAIGGATGASYTTAATVDADNGAVYAVTVTNGAGTVTSNGAALTVTPLAIAPSIATQPAGVSVTAGQAASFSVAATGSTPLTYQWQRDGSPIAAATAATYTLATTSAADSGATFTVVVGNAAGSVTSHAATLTVGSTLVAPSITAQPLAATVTAPATATFSVVATGSAPLAYQWRRNGTAISGATAPSYTTPATSVVADNGVQFSVVVSNGTPPSVTSGNAMLTVLNTPVAPTIATQPASVTVTAGATATFSVVANGSAPLAYQWRRNGTAIVGATNATYSTTATVAGDNGALFSVVVSNGTAPDAISSDATLTVTSVWTGIRQDDAPFPHCTNLPSTAQSDARSVSTDAQGNVVIVGITNGAWAASGCNSLLSQSGYVAKYNAAGALQWARLVLDQRNAFGVVEGAYGVGTDAAGNIYVTGDTYNALPGEVAAGGLDVYLAKFDPSGNRVWAHQFGSAQYDNARAIAVDANGNAVIVGYSAGQLPAQAPPAGTTNYFIARYDASGARQWLVEDVFNNAHPGPYNLAHGVALDAAGNAYLTGEATGSQFHGNGAFVDKFDVAGVRQWETQLAGAQPNDALPVGADGVAVSADGNAVYFSGRTYADFDTAGNPTVNPFCCTQGDAFVARLDGSGGLQWVHNLSSQTLSGPRYFDDEAYGVTTDSAGSAVYLAGYTAGVMPGNTSRGGEDLFVTRYEADGTRSWLTQLGAGLPATGSQAQNDRAYGITLDLHGDLFVVGSTIGTFGTPGADTDRPNWFVLKMKAADASLY